MKKVLKITLKVILIILIIIASIFIFGGNWFENYYNAISFNQLMFHLKVPTNGSNAETLYSFLNNCLLKIIIVSSILITMLFLIRVIKGYLVISIKRIKINLNLKIFANIVYYLFTTFFIVFGFVFAYEKLSIKEYLASQFEFSNVYEKYYVDPEKTILEFPKKKKNLIFILMESMESTYYDLNLISNLKKLTDENISFSDNDTYGGITQTTLTSWSFAGTVAATSGIGMNIPADGNVFTNMKASIFPGAYTIGEVLQSQGYNNYLIMGSDSKFAGTNQYFQQHGNYEIFDYNTAIKTGLVPKDYWEFWGIEDKKVYEVAKNKLSSISKEKEPFNMIVNTIDTHFTGYVDETCPTPFNNVIYDSINCADIQVYDFVNWIKSQPFYKNTTIVIMGDHLYMGNDFNNYNRHMLNLFINSGIKDANTNNRYFTTMDIYPTTLASLGVKIDGDRLALGTNLFSNKKTIYEEYGEEIQFELTKNSKYFNNNILYKKKSKDTSTCQVLTK